MIEEFEEKLQKKYKVPINVVNKGNGVINIEVMNVFVLPFLYDNKMTTDGNVRWAIKKIDNELLDIYKVED